MFWLMLMAGGVGIVLGLSLVQIHFITLVSAALVVAFVCIAPLAQWGLAASIGYVFALLAALQAGYLAGLVASRVWTRVRAPQTILRSSHIDQCRT